MVVEHPYVHTWFGTGGEVIIQILRVVKRRYVLMVLKGRTDFVPVPKPSARGMKRESAASPFPSGVVLPHTACVLS